MNKTDLPYEQLGFTLVREIKRNILITKKKGSKKGEFVCLKYSSQQEIELLGSVFPKVDQKKFQLSQLPEVREWGRIGDRYWIAMVYYTGTQYPWSEHDADTSGGRAIPIEAVDNLLSILKDLTTIALNLVEKIVPTFNDDYFLDNFKEKSDFLIQNGFLTREESNLILNEIRKSSNKDKSKQYIFTNGDFYFRNIIQQSSKKWVIIDWSQNLRFPITPSIEPIENLVAYVWLLMWNNKPWQKRWLDQNIKLFNLDKELLKKAMIIKTFNQAHFYEFICHDTKLAKIEVDLLRTAIKK